METKLAPVESVETIQWLRARWATPVGRDLKERLLRALRSKTQTWPDVLAHLPRQGPPTELDDLRGLTLDGVELPEIDLSFVDLSYAEIRNCNLRSVVLQGSRIAHAAFSSSSLGGADLLQAFGDFAAFDDADLSGAMMLSSSFRSANFSGSVLRAAILDRSDLTSADMRGADIRHATWRKAQIDDIRLDRETRGQPSNVAVGSPRPATAAHLEARCYEIVLVIHPDQSEQVPAMLEHYKGIVTASGGKVHRVEDWGRRQLAYMIQKLAMAHYVCLNIEVSKETLDELETGFRYNDAVLRHLTVVKAKAETTPSLMMKTVQAQALMEDLRLLGGAEHSG